MFSCTLFIGVLHSLHASVGFYLYSFCQIAASINPFLQGCGGRPIEFGKPRETAMNYSVC